MAASGAAKALVRRRAAEDVALMPPPPIKRIKRPSQVLDEDDYTDALSEIVARDYFPGLKEAHAQQEYLSALESNDQAWIAEASQKLRQTAAPTPQPRITRSAEKRNKASEVGNRASDTPLGNDGSETPSTTVESVAAEPLKPASQVETSKLSLSAFQARYTSEDNESFNTVLDKQNKKRREQHAYMWTEDQRLPSARQIAHREMGNRLLKESTENTPHADKSDVAMIPMSAGATESRPARPDAWKIKKPDNNFMFKASSIDDEDSMETTWNRRQAASKAGPRQIIHENTRFPPLRYPDDDSTVQIPPSPSLNTDIIAQRDAARAARSESDAQSEYAGGDTPRVNGYAFVDEDEPETTPAVQPKNEPSYRDLLAGQVSDATPNPFKLSQMRKREDLHHRMVEESAKKKKTKEAETVPHEGSATSRSNAGNMTPAARILMAKLGTTPVRAPAERMSSKEMWTPARTPRRKAVK